MYFHDSAIKDGKCENDSKKPFFIFMYRYRYMKMPSLLYSISQQVVLTTMRPKRSECFQMS